MGQAKNRGTREERVAQAIEAGRVKQEASVYRPPRVYDDAGEGLVAFYMSLAAVLAPRRRRR